MLRVNNLQCTGLFILGGVLLLDDYIEYLRSINSEIYRNGVRLPLNLDSDYLQVSRSVNILDDFLYYNRILSLCGSTYKIKSLSSGNEVLYSEVMKSEFFAEFMERRQNSGTSAQSNPADPMARHEEVQTLSSTVRNFENSEYSNPNESFSSLGVDDFMSKFTITPVEFEGDDDGDNYDDFEEEEYAVDAQGNRVSEEEYIASDDLVFDNYDELDSEDDYNFDDISSDDFESSSDEDNPYGDDLEFDSYSDDSSDSLESSLDEDSPYGDDLEFESYADEISDADAYAVSYEDTDEDDEFTLDSVVSTDISDDSGSDADILDSIALLGDLDEDTDADFGFDSEDNALGFDSADDDYNLSTEDTGMFDEDEDIGYDFDDEDEGSDYDFDEDIGYDFDDEDDSDYEEDAFGFDDIGDDSSDYDDSMYEDVEAGGMYDDSGEDLPDEDDNYFGSYLDDDDEEYFGYDDFQRDTSREYEESEIFSSGSSVEPQTQIINNVQSTSTPSAQSRDSDEVLADALVDGLSKVLKFGKSRLKNSGLLDKDTK